MKKAIFINALILFGAVFANYRVEKEIASCQKNTGKALRERKLLEQWLFVRQDHKRVSDYFQKRNIHTIAIYGMGDIGERLYDELRDGEVTVKYAIDQKGKRICSEIEVFSNSDISTLEKVDAIVITTIHCFEKVKRKISAQTDIPTLSLEEIIYEI
ncbi:MAG: hypothetical protein HDR09_04655 [Lachnospiraceae bacterium]|nr:hypothetical protein [Lachnospiraceae bacterium]